MVNREKRRIASDLIAQLMNGEITNADFEGKFPFDNDDPALHAIYQRLWLYWDDRTKHGLVSKYALNDEARELFTRCRAFLATDLEYEWPRGLIVAPLGLMLLRLLRLRKAVERRERREEERIRSFGDFDVWPFLRKQDLRA